ncbi:hypothetical protein BH23PLA1_BH23PLA1_20660 [soil metagenome]
MGIGIAPGGQLEGGIVAEVLMVVEILVSQGDGGDALGEDRLLIVDDEFGLAGVGDGRVEGVEEPELLFDFTQQEGAGVGGQSSALEIGDDLLGSEAGKGEGLLVTV